LFTFNDVHLIQLCCVCLLL